MEPLGFLTLRIVYSEPLVIYQLKFRFSYSCSGSHRDFWTWVSAPISCDFSVFPFLYSWGSVLPYDLTPLMNLTRGVDFSVCSVLYIF